MTESEREQLETLIGSHVHLRTVYGNLLGVLENPRDFVVRQGSSFIEFKRTEIDRIYFDKFWTITLKQRQKQFF